MLAFLALIILETFSIRWVAANLGWGKTIFLIFATAILGSIIARKRAKDSLKRLLEGIAGGNPGKEMFNAISLFLAAAFLIIPGFFSDAIGLCLLFPFVRSLLFIVFFKNSQVSMEFSNGFNSAQARKTNNFNDDNVVDIEAESVEQEKKLLD
jgi:UPF0716 protein FxsA